MSEINIVAGGGAANLGSFLGELVPKAPQTPQNPHMPPEPHEPPLDGGWRLSEAELNSAIKELDGFLIEAPENLVPPGLAGTGKLFPYVGWFWRAVSWDNGCQRGYKLYIPSDSAERYDPDAIPGDEPQFIGFMENNKWDYEEGRCTADSFRTIRKAFEAAVLSPTLETLRVAFQAVQDAIPEKRR